MDKFNVYYFFFIILVVNKKYIYAEDICDSSITFINCGIKRTSPLVFSRKIKHTVTAVYDGGKCETPTKYTWKLEGPRNFKNETTMLIANYTIAPYALTEAGKYKLSLSIEEFRDYKQNMKINECYLKLQMEAPQAIIEGGNRRNVHPGQMIVIDGSKSINNDFLNQSLLFEWTCKVQRVVDKKWCTKKQNKSIAIVPLEYAFPSAIYTFTLRVKSSKYSLVHKAEQTIFIIGNIEALQIVCVKNCVPTIHPIRSCQFHVICKGQCAPPLSFRWQINKKGFFIRNKVILSTDTQMLTIKEHALNYNDTYPLVVISTDPVYYTLKANFIIHTRARAQLISCRLQPPSGIALETEFRAICHYQPKDSYTFEIYTLRKGKATIFKIGSDLNHMPFTLTPSVKVIVVIKDQGVAMDQKIIKPKVSPLIPSNKRNATKTLMRRYFSNKSPFSIPKLMKAKNTMKAFELLHNMVYEVNDAYDRYALRRDEKTAADRAILDELLDSELSDSDYPGAVKQLQLTHQIVEKYKSDPEGNIAKIASQICYRSSEIIRTYAKSLSLEDLGLQNSTIKDHLRDALKCMLAAPKVVEDAITQPNTTITIRTPSTPTVYDLRITEEYDDYTHDENVIHNRYGFLSALHRWIYTLDHALETICLGMGLYNYSLKLDIGDIFGELEIIKEYGKNLSKRELKKNDVSVYLPKSLKPKNLYCILFGVANEDPFWWSQTKKCISPALILVIYDESKEEIQRTWKEKEGPSITYTSTKATDAAIIRSRQFTLPCKNCSEEMIVFRFTVGPHNVYKFNFFEVEDPGFTMCIIKYRKFTKSQCQGASLKYTVNVKNNTHVMIKESRKTLIYYYAGLIAIGNKTTSFFSVSVVTCQSYAPLLRDWFTGCEVNLELTKKNQDKYPQEIYCNCTKNSLYAARTVNIDFREEPEPWEIDVELFFCKYFLVYITLFIVLIIYFFLILWCLCLRRRQNIYFCGDVSATARYFYLVTLKTGNRSFSGSTSNIVLTLYGEVATSVPHVLNYPDPEKRFLQTGKDDWFALGTEHYLGDIRKIDVTINWVGVKPSWFCTAIYVFDLQMKKYWFFFVNEWFNIIEMKTNTYTFYAADQKIKQVNLRDNWENIFLLAIEEPHFWNFCQRFEYFSVEKRLTIILSQILSMIFFNVYMYGIPKFEFADCLKKYVEADWEVFIFTNGIISALGAFIVHFIFIFQFRKHALAKEFDDERSWWLIPYANRICWVLLILHIVACCIFVAVYGHWHHPVTQKQWLLSLIICVAFYVLILENLVRLINVCLYKVHCRAKHVFEMVDDALSYINEQRRQLFRKFGKFLIRPYLTNMYTIPTPGAFQLKQRKQCMRWLMGAIIADVIIILLYMLLLYYIILHEKGTLRYFSTTGMTYMVTTIYRRDSDKPQLDKFEQIHLVEDIYNFTIDSLIYAVQSGHWYGKYYVYNPGIMNNIATKYLGVMRLRQFRVLNHTSYIEPEMIDFFKTAYPAYSSSTEDTSDYSEVWEPYSFMDNFTRLGRSWRFNESGYHPTVIEGRVATYRGGGYMAKLGRNVKNSVTNMEYLANYKWLDQKSRLLLIEFIAFTPNANLFSSVRIMFEIIPTGYIEKYVEVASEQLIFPKIDWIAVIIYCIFIFVVIVITTRLYLDYREDTNDFWSHPWNYVDIPLVILSFLCILLYLKRLKDVENFLIEVAEKEHNKFIEYHHLFRQTMWLTVFSAVLIGLSVLRFWKTLQACLVFRIIERALRISSLNFTFGYLFYCYFIASFTFVGIILYGDRIRYFKNGSNAYIHVFAMTLNMNKNMFALVHNDRFIDFLYVLLLGFLCVSFSFLMKAVICYAHREARLLFSAKKQYPFHSFLWEECLFYQLFCWVRCRSRLRGGDNEELNCDYYLVQPKELRYRYSKYVATTFTRFLAMTNVARCVLENEKIAEECICDDVCETLGGNLTEDRFELMQLTAATVFGKQQGCKILYLKVRNYFDLKKAFLIDDRRMCEMAKIARILVSTETGDQDYSTQAEYYRNTMEKHLNKLEFLDCYLQKLEKYIHRI